jgi:hypothetical protein
MNRTTQAGDRWQSHAREETIVAYGRLLHRWTHALMMSIEGPAIPYRFPLLSSDQDRLDKLKTSLQNNKQEDAIEALHDVFKHIFYPRPLIGGSKWSSIIECLWALHSLQEDGNFKPPVQVTGMFAQTHYHIRGSILYEGMRNKSDFDDDLEKQVFGSFFRSIIQTDRLWW